MSQSPFKVASIGIGWSSDVLADAAGRTGGRVEVVSCFTRSEDKRVAFAKKYGCEAAGSFEEPIVTTIEPLETFYPAEAYHHDYYNQHQSAPYCAFVISPKLDKLRDRLTGK